MRSARTTRSGILRAGATIALVLAALSGVLRAIAAQGRPLVYVVPIEGMIDMGLAPFVQRILDEAQRETAAAVILDINTFGGRVDAAVLIRDALLSTPVSTVGFVNRRAISAGALICLAAERVAMTEGGTIGAATPVQMGPGGEAALPTSEKTVSYVRKEFRATADSRERPGAIAEAMVDSDVEIEGLIEKGKLLTLTTDEALAHGVADFRADTLEALLAELGLADAEVRETAPNWGERFVRLITHPILASILLSAAMLGILIEIRTPGFGVPGILGVLSLVLVLGGHWVVQLVGWEELLLASIGIVLLLLEAFVIPGFGLAGLLGIAALLGAMTMALVGRGATWRSVGEAAGRVGLSTLIALALGAVLMRFLSRSPIGRRLVLETGLPPGGGEEDTSPMAPSRWLGRVGRAASPLRPAGIAELDSERVDVVSQGELIESGAAIVVTRVDGNRIVVRRRNDA